MALHALVLGLILPLLAAEPPPEVLTLEGAMDRAERDTRDMIRARADRLSIDIEKARALAAVLPSLSFYFAANEIFLESNLVEAREAGYYAPCVPPASGSCLVTPAGGGNYELRYGGFYDARANSVSQLQLTGGISARQLLYDGGRWWAVLARVDDLRRHQESLFQVIRAGARLNALRRFYDLVRATEAVKVSELQLELAEAQLWRARSLLKEGQGGPTDVASAERNLSVDRVSLARRIFTRKSAGRSLALALGQDPEREVAIHVPEGVVSSTITLHEVHLPSKDQLLAMALTHRPEVKQARALLSVTERNIDIRIADYYPTIALGLSYSRLPTRYLERLLADPTQSFSAVVGLDLRWTLFSGGTTQAAVAESELELIKARANLAEVSRQVKSDALEKADELLLLVETQRLNLDGARSAKAADDVVQVAYRQGKVSALELRDAEQKLTQAMLDAIVGGINIEVGRAELSRAVGIDLEGGPPIYASAVRQP